MVTVNYCLLADRVDTRGTHQDIHGANIVGMRPAALPAVMPRLSVALSLRVPYAELGATLAVLFDIVDEEGRSLLPARLGVELQTAATDVTGPGEDQLVPVSHEFTDVSYGLPGRYGVAVWVDGVEVARPTFLVAARQP